MMAEDPAGLIGEAGSKEQSEIILIVPSLVPSTRSLQ